MTEKTAGRTRRLLTNVLTAVLVLGAVGGGVAYTAVTVDGADRTAPTVAWADPTVTPPADPVSGLAKGRASTPLSKLLLPVPEGYWLGSDIEGYGNDDELGAKESEALFKKTSKGLYGKKRREFEKQIDALGIQGMAMRSYASQDSDLQVEVSVLRMKDKKAVRAFFELHKELAEFVDMPKGPRVKDHAKNAACWVVPDPAKPEDAEDKEQWEERLRAVTCAAYDGEVAVSVWAAGATRFDKKAVAELLEKQLRHIESPGEYV
ncbi:hypothetical protein OG357_17875 [Streptomyces sp. NBC_01255]|uniref:hypothetical protein n=1 Tax=Streptomyces sp. NBC_01255 TaxID=2903798 RepID=UPI002E36F75C|nr:hypothetical protein [Streptomyces sp. NBC_01255]